MWRNLDEPRQIVLASVARGWNNCRWLDMVADPQSTTHGCLLLHSTACVPMNRWNECGFYAAHKLRRAFPFKRADWVCHDWPSDADRVLHVVGQVIEQCASLPQPCFRATEQDDSPLLEEQASGFMPWRLFRRRAPVPRLAGVYLIGHFKSLPEEIVDPLSANTIYIGKAGGEGIRNSLQSRLADFESTAYGGTGHSAGWTYGTEFVHDWESLVLFRDTYVSWRAMIPKRDGDPRTVELRLIGQYRKTHGDRPFLNRKD
jgi:hypothetical protein